MITQFDYEKPELLEFSSDCAKGESCYVDCPADDVCPTSVDNI